MTKDKMFSVVEALELKNEEYGLINQTALAVYNNTNIERIEIMVTSKALDTLRKRHVVNINVEVCSYIIDGQVYAYFVTPEYLKNNTCTFQGHRVMLNENLKKLIST